MKALKRTDLYARSRKGMRRINVACDRPFAGTGRLAQALVAPLLGAEDHLDGVGIPAIDGRLDRLSVVLEGELMGHHHAVGKKPAARTSRARSTE